MKMKFINNNKTSSPSLSSKLSNSNKLKNYLKTKDYKLKTNFGFTLVELIVVIVILGILATIAFLSFKDYSSDARDSNRMSNVALMSRGLDLNITTGKFINLSEVSTGTIGNIVINGNSGVTFTGYYEDSIGPKFLSSIGVSGNGFTDDSFQSYRFTYIPSNKYYQVMGLLENQPLSSYIDGIFFKDLNVSAEETGSGFAFIKGNFPINTASGGNILGIIPVQSIFNTNYNTSSGFATITGTIASNIITNLSSTNISSSNSSNVYTLSGTFGTNGSGANISVCGSDVTADSSGNFSRTSIPQGTACNNITATRAGYSCTTTTDGPPSISSDVNNVAGSCISDYTPESCFTFNSSTKTITAYSSSCTKNVVIPPTIGGVAVQNIGDSAFAGKSLLSVTIPNSVINIKNIAFAWNQITNITIPNSVTSIGDDVFRYNQLTSVIFSSGLISIGNSTFQHNQLTSVTISNSVTSIGTLAFNNNKLTNITIPNSVTSIGTSAFASNQLTNVTIPNSLISISNGIFQDNKLTSVTIPNSVTSIGAVAFADNKLTSVTIPNSVINIYGAAFNNNLLPDNQAFIYKRNNNGSVDDTTLVSYGGINKNPIIPNNVNSIGDRAFAGNQLTSVTIPNSVTSIGGSAFLSNQLTSVTIPNSVTAIYNNAFYLNQLQDINLFENLDYIGNEAFMYNFLTNVTIPNSVTDIGSDVFSYNGLTQESNNIFDWSSGVGGTWNLDSNSPPNWVKQ